MKLVVYKHNFLEMGFCYFYSHIPLLLSLIKPTAAGVKPEVNVTAGDTDCVLPEILLRVCACVCVHFHPAMDAHSHKENEISG